MNHRVCEINEYSIQLVPIRESIRTRYNKSSRGHLLCIKRVFVIVLQRFRGFGGPDREVRCPSQVSRPESRSTASPATLPEPEKFWEIECIFLRNFDNRSRSLECIVADGIALLHG